MRRLVAAEMAKLFTTRLWLWLLLASMALAALYASLTIGFRNEPDNVAPPLDSPAGQQLLFAVAAGAAQPLVAVLAAIGLTGEFRHRTVSATFLAVPRRRRVVVAKLVTYALVGAAYALACVAVVAAIAIPWLAAEDVRVPLTGHGIPATVAGVVAAVVIFASLGVGMGALLREQVATVVGLLVYLFVAEPIVTRIPALADWTKYLPGPASNALTRITLDNQEFLRPWQGGLALAAYGLAVAITGTIVAARRDVT
jgi:ABC-2 type transport system permease protein